MYRPTKPPALAGQPRQPVRENSGAEIDEILLRQAQRYLDQLGVADLYGLDLLDRMNRSYGHDRTRVAIEHMKQIRRLLSDE